MCSQHRLNFTFYIQQITSKLLKQMLNKIISLLLCNWITAPKVTLSMKLFTSICCTSQMALNKMWPDSIMHIIKLVHQLPHSRALYKRGKTEHALPPTCASCHPVGGPKLRCPCGAGCNCQLAHAACRPQLAIPQPTPARQHHALGHVYHPPPGRRAA